MCLRSTSGATKVLSLCAFCATAAPLIVYNCLYIYVQAVKVTWLRARKKDTIGPKYYWCRMIVCDLGQNWVHTKCGRYVGFGATAASYRRYIYVHAVNVTWPGAKKRDRSSQI